jgi:DNA repair protein RecO (recombination protein O)
MIVHSPAVVLRRFSYSDTSIIARCFTQEMGKISFMIRGAKRKKSPQTAFYEPMSHLDLVFYYNERRDMQTVSKASFATTYKNINGDLKRIAYGMAVVELTEKTIIDHDPHSDLFIVLLNILHAIDTRAEQLNLVYWYYQIKLLTLLGFKPDLDNREFAGLVLPDPTTGPNSAQILSFLISGSLSDTGFQSKLNKLSVSSKDRKVISQYINTCLYYHFDGLKELKSLGVLKALVTA